LELLVALVAGFGGVDAEAMGLVGIEECLAVQFQRPHFSFRTQTRLPLALNPVALKFPSRRVACSKPKRARGDDREHDDVPPE